MKARIPLGDEARVAALHRLNLLDQPPSEDFQGLTRLAAQVTGAPISALNLIDADRQWQAAVTGTTAMELSREESLCQHTVFEDRLVHVADVHADPRFGGNQLLRRSPEAIRLYCGVPVHDHAGHAVGSLCVVDRVVRELTPAQLSALRDVAAQVERVLELRWQQVQLVELLAEVDRLASHDPLTGLVNRRVLSDRLDVALERSRRTHVPPVVFFCDLDKFKTINDTFGHRAGDVVLAELGARLRHSSRITDTVARFGGDEFVILCESLPAEQQQAVCDRLRAVCDEPVQLPDGTLVVMSMSVGWVAPSGYLSSSDLLRAADDRMYAEKRTIGSPGPLYA